MFEVKIDKETIEKIVGKEIGKEFVGNYFVGFLQMTSINHGLRTITTCVISLGEHQHFGGIAVRHPCDDRNVFIGNKVAFGRAIDNMMISRHISMHKRNKRNIGFTWHGSAEKKIRRIFWNAFLEDCKEELKDE